MAQQVYRNLKTECCTCLTVFDNVKVSVLKGRKVLSKAYNEPCPICGEKEHLNEYVCTVKAKPRKRTLKEKNARRRRMMWNNAAAVWRHQKRSDRQPS